MKSRNNNFPRLKMSYKMISTLMIFTILETISSEDSRIVYSAEAQPKDVESLRSVTSKEALPIVLFVSNENDGHFFRYPASLEKAAINKDGRLVTGTEFSQLKPSPFPQIFFCPNPKATEKCLVSTKFEESQVLECKLEPIPIVAKRSRKTTCGFRGTGTMWRLLYEICPSEEVNLFSEKLLEKEREIKPTLGKNTYKIIDPQYYKFLSNTNKKKKKYEFQKLVPTDNMALATWRKTTYQYLNIGLQHGKLSNLWNEINRNIRTNAEESDPDTPRNIMTGVFDIPNHKLPKSKDRNQMYNVWITMVTDLNTNPANGKINLNPIHGIAILMNNFILNDTPSNSEQYIDEICGESYCVDTFTSKFGNVGGEVRCCKVTAKIYNLFWGQGGTFYPFDLLKIRDITFTRPPE